MLSPESGPSGSTNVFYTIIQIAITTSYHELMFLELLLYLTLMTCVVCTLVVFVAVVVVVVVVVIRIAVLIALLLSTLLLFFAVLRPSCRHCWRLSFFPSFLTLLRRDFQESQLKEIELKGVTSLGLRAVLDFVYTSRLALNSNHIHDILQTASHLQFNQVIEYCCQFLKCVEHLNIFDYRLPTIKSAAPFERVPCLF